MYIISSVVGLNTYNEVWCTWNTLVVAMWIQSIGIICLIMREGADKLGKQNKRLIYSRHTRKNYAHRWANTILKYTTQSLKANRSNCSNLVPFEHVPPIIVPSSINGWLSLRSHDRWQPLQSNGSGWRIIKVILIAFLLFNANIYTMTCLLLVRMSRFS